MPRLRTPALDALLNPDQDAETRRLLAVVNETVQRFGAAATLDMTRRVVEAYARLVAREGRNDA